MDSLLVDTLQQAAVVADTLSAAPDTFHVIFDPSRLINLDIHGNGNSLVVTLIGMGVVFSALFAIYMIFSGITLFLGWVNVFRVSKKENRDDLKASDLTVSGEVNAAIAMALHLHLHEIHDDENLVLTIKRVAKTYSPWNSKIYNLRQLPQKQVYRR